MLCYFYSYSQQLKFGSEEYNFGSINAGDTIICEFHFINIGKEPIIISDITTSCPCVKPNWLQAPYTNTEHGKLTLRYISIGKMGIQDQTASIISNSKDGIITLHLKGNVNFGEFIKDSIAKTIKASTLIPEIANFFRAGNSKDSWFHFGVFHLAHQKVLSLIK